MGSAQSQSKSDSEIDLGLRTGVWTNVNVSDFDSHSDQASSVEENDIDLGFQDLQIDNGVNWDW